MFVSKATFDALLAAAGTPAVAAEIRATFTVAEPKRGDLYRASNGQPRLLVADRLGRQAVVNPDTGRLLVHEDGEVFTSWAHRIATDGYTPA